MRHLERVFWLSTLFLAALVLLATGGVIYLVMALRIGIVVVGVGVVLFAGATYGTYRLHDSLQ